MQVDRRAYFNLLRLSWLDNPETPAEEWAVLDYRALPLETLFENAHLDKASFLALVEAYDTPEELADALEGDDRLYLTLFELWRRLTPEKQSLSLFCDELDHLIYLYDNRQLESVEQIEDILGTLQIILDENTDQGADPKEVFSFLKQGLVHDLEDFLYAFIAEQIDHHNYPYASELLDNLGECFEDVRWFTFLKIRILDVQDPPAAQLFIRQLVRMAPEEPDLDFNLEVLHYLVQGGEREIFADLLRQTISLLRTEEDFQELLNLCSEYFRCLDHDKQEKAIQTILHARSERPLQCSVQQEDPDFSQLLHIVS